MSSRKQAIRCVVGILIMNAKTSSMNVLKALYIKAFHGKCATDFLKKQFLGFLRQFMVSSFF